MSYLKRLRISPRHLTLSLVLAALAIHFGFDAGTVTETQRVTVTHVVDHPVGVPATSGGPRIGSLPARTQWEYRVMCTTIHGQPCFVVTQDHVRYQRGQLITAEVELQKPEGVFGWTFTCRLFVWLSLIVLAWGLWKGRKSWEVPEATPASAIAQWENPPRSTPNPVAALLRSPEQAKPPIDSASGNSHDPSLP